MAMDGVSLSLDTGKESRMIHIPVAVFDFNISVLHLAAPCFFLGLRDFFSKTNQFTHVMVIDSVYKLHRRFD